MLISFLNYLQFEKRYSPHTLISYTTDINQFNKYLQATYTISDPSFVDYPIIRSWIVALATLKLNPKTLHRKISTLRSYFKYLHRQKLISINPTLRLRTPKIPKRLPIYLQSKEMDAVLDTVSNFKEDTFEGIRDKLIIEMLYGTGMRRSELIGLSKHDIDMHQGVVKVTGKGNKQRLIPLHQELLAHIEKYKQAKNTQFPDNNNDVFIVTDTNSKAYPIFISRIVNKSLNIITTLEKKSPHVLRHSFATNLLNNGADLNAIKELLGHSSLAATQVYTHNSLGKLKEIFDQAHPKSKS